MTVDTKNGSRSTASSAPRKPLSSKESVSDLTTGRLSVYLRCLTYLESIRQETVSSHELARRFHLNSAQIRKDLAHFGELGIRGVGYNVSRLKEHLVSTLGLDRLRRVIIVGAGNLGMALADYRLPRISQ
jgi:redox-sensing transcriptional repressor